MQHYERKPKRLPIAREFVSAAVANILRNLRYRANRDTDCSEQLNIIEAIEAEIPHAQTVDELMGYEGNIRETYYRAFNAIIDLQTPFEKAHPPTTG